MKRLFFFLVIPLFFPMHVFAFSMNGSGYSVENSSIDLSLPTPTPIVLSKPLQLPLSPTPETSSYAITVPKEDHTDTDYFGITVKNSLIDFGESSPTNPILRDTTVRVDPGKSFGYGVFIEENASLTNTKGQIIPDTSCDNGICNEINASTWSNILSFGFGYRCDSTCEGFSDSLSFKRLPKTNSNEPISLLSRGTANETQDKTILYKLITSQTQQKGSYSNIITLSLVPTL